MTIDINELRRKLQSDDLIDHIDLHANIRPLLSELLDRLEAAEKERDALRAALRHEADCVEAAKAEIAALRAKITEMERQEIGFQERCTPSSPTGYSNRFPLYALPGAQNVPSVPDFSNTKDAARYRWLRENGLAHEKRESRAVLPRGGKKASMAFRYWTTPEELDMAIDAMIAAAPEAKP